MQGHISGAGRIGNDGGEFQGQPWKRCFGKKRKIILMLYLGKGEGDADTG